jgi:hypothetical protein
VLFLITISCVSFAENQLTCLNSIFDSAGCHPAQAVEPGSRNRSWRDVSSPHGRTRMLQLKARECGLFFIRSIAFTATRNCP